MNKLHICFVHEEYPDETDFGGIATYQKRIALALNSIGHRITVISMSLKSNQAYKEDGIFVYRIKRPQTSNEFDNYVEYRKKLLRN